MKFFILFGSAFLLSLQVQAADFYKDQVQPIFNNRCLACHSCFNAPCQLNLQDYEGFSRGATKLNVYNGLRLHSVFPTRLWVDAQSTQGWRDKGFFPISSGHVLKKSLFFQMLQLRLDHPMEQPKKSVAESMVCAKDMEEQANLAKTSPELGMPYGFPTLTSKEIEILGQWIQAGTPGPTAESMKADAALTAEQKRQTQEWEAFFNGKDLRHQLVSRYIYEHLFLAHLYFEKDSDAFFRLVRSRKECNKGVDEIATRRPNDPPGTGAFFYCFKRWSASVVEKTHMPYRLSSEKKSRWKELFFASDWKVEKLPGYENQVAENPFVAFSAIPVKARYQFLLDDAQYEISTFIKGPVCNGSSAVNSIQEQFYVFFLSPQADNMVLSQSYANKVKVPLMLPGVWGSDVPPLETLSFMKKLVEHREKYRRMRFAEYKKLRPNGYTLQDIWDGDGNNPNAVLTVFRHFDNAVVLKGAVGDLSKTIFVLDYPLFERLVYNLVVNFDVFGNIGHQALTRIYMDMIRMEAEEIFLSFLPAKERTALRASWYRGFLTEAKMNYLFPPLNLDQSTGVTYKNSHQAKEEFVADLLFSRFKPTVRGSLDPLNWKALRIPKALQEKAILDNTEKSLTSITSIVAKSTSPFARYFPDVAYLLVHDGKKRDRVFTVIHNREHENISWILGESLRMSPEEDTLTLHEGFAASYPNMIFAVDAKNLSSFSSQITKIKSDDDYKKLVAHFGVPRTRQDFWSFYDRLNRLYKETENTQFGYLDLTRYELAP